MKLFSKKYGRMWKYFKSRKSGYVSFIILSGAYVLSFILPVFIGSDALVVRYNGDYYFPVFKHYESTVFGQNYEGEANYRFLKKTFKSENNGNFVIMPLYPYGAEENLLNEIQGNPPHPPSGNNIFGTDESGRDVFAKVFYGFRISFSFSLLVTLISFVIGIIFGSLSGYYRGWIDTTGQRFVEIMLSIPFLYIMMILASIFRPGFYMLVIMLSVFGWMAISLYVRGEFLRESAKDYVLSAVTAGSSNLRIIIKHILPNALTPVISFLPFVIVANISSLVSLDFLGFGIPPPSPSWGNMISQGLNNLNNWWLALFPLSALFVTLMLIVLIGESFRYALNPEGKISNSGAKK
ncbi:MAG: ABC transporter permease subunit [Ignavibacteria bacterium]|nr:ABC transporter permease subunit [Ignavibacteria bacterium]